MRGVMESIWEDSALDVPYNVNGPDAQVNEFSRQLRKAISKNLRAQQDVTDQYVLMSIYKANGELSRSILDEMKEFTRISAEYQKLLDDLHLKINGFAAI